MTTAPSKMSKPRSSSENSYPYNRQTDCLTVSDRSPYDLGRPTTKRVYSLSEIEQNFNIRSTTFGCTSGPGPDGRPPSTPFCAATPDVARLEFKLDSRLLHEAITRSCTTGLHGGLQQGTINEQAAAAVILMGMDSCGSAPYEPTLVDIRYHEFCCAGVLTPRVSEDEIMADMQLVEEAIEQDKKTRSMLSFGDTARQEERAMDAPGVGCLRMEWASSTRGG